MSKKKAVASSKLTVRLVKLMQGLLGLTGAVLLMLSILSFSEGNPQHNCLGLSGHAIAWGLLHLFGLCGYFVPLFLGWESSQILLNRSSAHTSLKLICYGLLFFALPMLFSAIAYTCPSFAALFDRWVYSDLSFTGRVRHYLGGVPFYYLYAELGKASIGSLLGNVGSFLIFSMLSLVALLSLIPMPFEMLWEMIKKKGKQAVDACARPKEKQERQPFEENGLFTASSAVEKEDVEALFPLQRQNPLATLSSTPALKKENKKEKLPIPSPTPLAREMNGYSLPSPNLLTAIKKPDLSALRAELQKHALVLEETLLSFGIEAKVGEIQYGPTIALFEVLPAVGVKVQKIKALENDIALNLQAKSLRIIAPIPGKAAVGIEVPNPQPHEVSFRELVESYQARGVQGQIPLLLGKAVNGDDIWIDLTKMPHCLIAGATGSGKSVCINTIVMSILMNARPDEIKFIMIDPKKVELTAYSRLPHMLAPVITEAAEAHGALIWLVKEMERRYEIFRQTGFRNIMGFNSRTVNTEEESSLTIPIPERLPYIVVIVDELADLMMVTTNDIETPIARIAQMARAVGIHMILATQRPSREVITGLIKANFPTRISFKVASRINSQIIIDDNGAEALLGNGDMLFMPPGTSFLTRAQGAFIRDEDINRVIDFIAQQMSPNYLLPSFKAFRLEEEEEQEYSSGGGGDSLYEDAKKLIYETGNASTTFLQRKLKLGYARAAGVMDELEKNGVIGPQEGAKPRKIFYPSSMDPNEKNRDLE